MYERYKEIKREKPKSVKHHINILENDIREKDFTSYLLHLLTYLLHTSLHTLHLDEECKAIFIPTAQPPLSLFILFRCLVKSKRWQKNTVLLIEQYF